MNRAAIGLGVFLFLGTGAATADDGTAPVETFGVAGPSYEKSLEAVRPTPSEKMGIDLSAVPEVRLAAVDVDALLLEDARGKGKAVRFGIGRDVRVSAGGGHWYFLPDGGRLWVAEVVSTDALGVRLHFQDVRLPAGAELAVYAPAGNDPVHGEVRNGSPRFDPDRYVELYAASGILARRGAFWTGSLAGERARIEYLAPAGAPEDELPFTIDRLQHIYLDPVASLAKGLTDKRAAGPCHNDVTCFPEWREVARAVAGLGIIGEDSFFCTGQLLTTRVGDFTPYWLTSNHCLSDQEAAESAEFFWLYQTAACGGAPPSLASVPRSQGATLLSTNPESDYTLLMVEGALPRGLFWAGWTSAPVDNGTPAAGIHHPSADFKRISFGYKNAAVGFCNVLFGSGGSNLVRINWTDGVTEPGSSGSGIFREDTQQLFGQLFGGPSSCAAPPSDRFDCYGSFAATYPSVKTLLEHGSDDKTEPNDRCDAARVVRAGEFPNRIVKILDEDWYKIPVKAGRKVTVDLSFVNANGNIDLQVFSGCNHGALQTADGTADGETLTVTNSGRKRTFAIFRIFLANDTRNSYDMSVRFE